MISRRGFLAGSALALGAGQVEAAGGLLLGSTGAPYLGPVAGRAYYPDTKLTTSGTWNSRTGHVAMDDVTAIKLMFMQVFGIGEVAAGAPSTTTASIEYPAGTFSQVKFGGSASVVIASGAVQFSDFTSVVIPKGAQFWVRHFQTTTALMYLAKTNGRPLNTSLGDAVNHNQGDLTMSGTVVDDGSGSMIPVSGIFGMTRLPTLGALGSSRMAGKFDQTLDGTGLYGYTRMFGGSFAFLDLAVGGEPFVGVATSTQGTLRRSLVNTYTSHQWLDPGLNDINSSVAASVVLAAIDTAATAFPGGKARTIVNNEAPWTTSTDAWATSVNQTPFAAEAQRVVLNTGIAALTGYNQIVDAASFMSNGTNGSLWNNPAVGGSQFTTDGTHEISAPLVALAAAGRFNPALLHRP